MKKVLSFDIGGTNTRLALINENYEIEKQLILPTIRDNKEAFLESIKNIILKLDVDLSNVSAIGAGIPGVVNRETGYIYFLPNIHIDDIPLGEFIKKELNIPLFIRNDAEVACLAEATLGAGKDYSRVFFITISTGLGGAFVIDKKNQDYVTEIGHTAYKFEDEWTIYEALASGTGIKKTCLDNGLNVENASEFFKLVDAKNSTAICLYNKWQMVMHDFLTLIKNSYDPDIVTITGGVMHSKDYFFSDLKGNNPLLNIVEAKFEQEAGLIGAAVYAFNMLDE